MQEHQSPVAGTPPSLAADDTTNNPEVESDMDATDMPAPGLGLLGIEIGSTAIRLVLLDSTATQVTDAVERPIGAVGRALDHHAETGLQTALLAALEAVGLSEPTPLLTGVTVGLPECGVGSGPALTGWLEDLSRKLGQQFLCAGERGKSYAPLATSTFLRRVFDPLPLHLDRVELAPVAACRVMAPLHPGTVSLGSGVAWSARVLGNEVLEAYEIAGGPVDQVLSVVTGEGTVPIAGLEGVEVDEELLRRRDLDLAALAPAVGVAVALHTTPPTNLLAAGVVGQAASARAASRPSAPTAVSQQGAVDPMADDPRFASPGSYRERDDRRPLPDQQWDPTGPAVSERYPAYAAPAWDADDAYRPVPVRGAAGVVRAAPDAGFHVSDFVLGALLMLLLVLTAALVLL
jgi:hypothetical protein